MLFVVVERKRRRCSWPVLPSYVSFLYAPGRCSRRRLAFRCEFFNNTVPKPCTLWRHVDLIDVVQSVYRVFLFCVWGSLKFA